MNDDLALQGVLNALVPPSEEVAGWADVLRRAGAPAAEAQAAGASIDHVSHLRVRISERARKRRLLVAIAVALAVAAPTVAFAHDLGQLFGFSNAGTPTQGFPTAQLSAMKDAGFASGVARLGERAGIAFYVARTADGRYCFGTGSASAPTPSLDLFACDSEPGSFPSASRPIADFSAVRTTGSAPSQTYITRLEGFAADEVAAVGFLDPAGQTEGRTPVDGNIYANSNPPAVPAIAIVAFDSRGDILYRKPLTPPPTPQPQVPGSNRSGATP